MKLAKLFILVLVLAPTFLFAQGNITYRLGEMGKKQNINEGITYNTSKTLLSKNSTINVYANDKEYTVSKFDIAVLPKKGELLGPYRINSANVLDIAAAMGRDVTAGDRVYIDQIRLSCADCTETMQPKGMAINIKVQ